MDNSELEIIYDLHFKKIYKYFYYKVLSREIAEDLTSETFLTFVDLTKKEEPENASAFLYGVAKNIFMRFLDKKYRMHFVSGIDLNQFGEISDFLSEIEKMEEKQTIEEYALKYIEKLPEKQKQVLKMRLIDKMSLDEISKALGKNMNHIKTTQKRGIKKLKQIIACTP